MNRLSGRLLLIVAAFALLLVIFPLAATGAGSFDDVPDGHTFKADIEWLASVGVTKGCNPPDNTLFCPDDPVTRGQMAAFIHRLADWLAGTYAAIGHNHDADYLAIDGKAADADKLDGLSSSAFIHGAGWHEADRTFNNWNPGIERTATLDCPGMDYPISGGAVEIQSGIALTESFPYFNSMTDRGWQISYENMSGSTIMSTTFTMYVMCGDFDLLFMPLPLSASSNPDSESE